MPAKVTPSGIIFSDRVRDLSELAEDDEAAEAEALAQVGGLNTGVWRVSWAGYGDLLGRGS